MQYVFNDHSAKFYSLMLIFSTLCVVHDLIFQWKLLRRRLPVTFVYFESHASMQMLQLITFMQCFRMPSILYSPFRKPKIFDIEDKWSKFEWSRRDLYQFSELCKWSLTRAQLSKQMDLCCFVRFIFIYLALPNYLRQGDHDSFSQLQWILY